MGHCEQRYEERRNYHLCAQFHEQNNRKQGSRLECSGMRLLRMNREVHHAAGPVGDACGRETRSPQAYISPAGVLAELSGGDRLPLGQTLCGVNVRYGRT